MTVWDTYPTTYREVEVQKILTAVRAGECVSVIGLSGAGKSNLMGSIAHRVDAFPHPNVLVDCNRLRENSVDAFFRLIRASLGDTEPFDDEWSALETTIARSLSENGGQFTILLDRFEFLSDPSTSQTSLGRSGQAPNPAVFSNLRALRDLHKYQLTFVTATRRPLDPSTEFAELIFAHTVWLGPLSESDARWNVTRYAQRVNQNWGTEIAEKMMELTWGYPSLLRAVSEAYAGGAKLEVTELREHAAVRRRIDEFWADDPSDADIQTAGLEGQPLLKKSPAAEGFDTAQLTAKEILLLEYFQSHPGKVCSKDNLIRAVWPEDQIYERGIRDDSLAQLVRRLRVKIEPDPSNPKYINTVPGRGYRFKP